MAGTPRHDAAEFGQALASARYNLVRDLGRGGMGAVYLVRHVDTVRAADRCRTLARVRDKRRAVHLGYFIFPEGPSLLPWDGCHQTSSAKSSGLAEVKGAQ
jgi:serine/threonine protein kinase